MSDKRNKGGKHRETVIGGPIFEPNISPEAMQAIEAEWMGQGNNRALFISFPLEWCSSLAVSSALFDKAERIADGKADH